MRFLIDERTDRTAPLSQDIKLMLTARRFVDDIWHLQFAGMQNETWHPVIAALECPSVFYDTRPFNPSDDFPLVVAQNGPQHQHFLDPNGTPGIYPVQLNGPNGVIAMPLELNLAAQGTDVPFLDVRVRMVRNTKTGKLQLHRSHYDKRRGIEAFKKTINFPSIESCISDACKYGTLSSALHRFNISTSTRSGFQRAATRQAISMVEQGYDHNKVLDRVRRFSHYSPSKGRWRAACDNICRMVQRWVHKWRSDEL